MGQRSSLVVIGNEILSGRTSDKNINWIAEHMTKHGVPLAEVRVVPDIEEKIIEAVNVLRDEYDYVFTTGGIGPTHDDITATSIAKAMGVVFERHAEAYHVLLDYYGPDELNETRARMANMPRGARLLLNPVSGAPGFAIENVFVMAGVPRIMRAMLEHVIAEIKPGAAILSNTVFCDLKESIVAEGLREIQGRYETVDIGSYPSFRGGALNVSVVLRGTDEATIRAATKEVLALVERCGGGAQSLSFQVPVDD
ncbi:MAG TPA: molybdopterin-binding protein [Alphaproteobacteria bacterium]|nr:competence/damage-inducible protein A [Alphaproteobacteria bacterium]USO05879.1 MAG: competence/damage-inducible protein A [Rhodospirillales bacterium]HOO81049.1 molybdopterin-binding protein [Alphaproteobacteria bacterium]